MTLKYNTQSYKRRQDPTNFLNTHQTNEGFSPEILSENYNDGISIFRASDGTETATQDFILTEIQGQCYCGDAANNAGGGVTVSYKGETIFKLDVSTEAGGYLAQTGNAKFPSWLIKEGETFTFNVTNTNGGGSAVLIGYKV